MTAAGDPGTLYVVGTPIGNLEDISMRALRVLGEVAMIAAEDTRVTAKLLNRYQISTHQLSLNAHNAARAVPKLIGRLRAGEDVALVSDAGTPVVSDPGHALVSEAAAQGISVTPIPGACAAIAAVSAAGLTGTEMRFFGFLPRSGRRRQDKLTALALDPGLIVIYEAPKRLSHTLADLARACGPERPAAVFRELTKLHEEIARGTLAELADRFAGDAKGEVTIVIGGSGESEETWDDPARLREVVAAELQRGRSAKEIATYLSRVIGLGRKLLYQLALEIIAEQGIPPTPRG